MKPTKKATQTSGLFVFNLKLRLLIAKTLDDLLGYACVGEAAVMEEVLHGDVFGEV